MTIVIIAFINPLTKQPWSTEHIHANIGYPTSKAIPQLYDPVILGLWDKKKHEDWETNHFKEARARLDFIKQESGEPHDRLQLVTVEFIEKACWE